MAPAYSVCRVESVPVGVHRLVSDDDLSAAERIMREKKVRRLPVLNKQGRLVGLLSISDIARRADEEYARGAANRYVTDAEVARLAAAVSESRRTSRLA